VSGDPAGSAWRRLLTRGDLPLSTLVQNLVALVAFGVTIDLALLVVTR
jgi:uncharacterized membrane protein YdfJ with MMPL/SSD domain